MLDEIHTRQYFVTDICSFISSITVRMAAALNILITALESVFKIHRDKNSSGMNQAVIKQTYPIPKALNFNHDKCISDETPELSQHL